MKARLIVLGEGSEIRHVLRPGQVYLAGRGRGSSLHLDNSSVSRRHALIELRPNGVYVTDLGSANGTVVQGQALEAGLSAPVPSGEVIHCAEARVLVEIVGFDTGERARVATLRSQDGPRLGSQFELSGRIGEGTYSRVWAAWHKPLKRMVAVKVLRSGVGDTDARERFEREARVLGRFDSTHVVRLYDARLDQANPYIIMELVQGSTLLDLMDQPSLDLSLCLSVAEGIARALDAVHQQRVVHRDVKPANVLVAPRQVAKLADFGVVRELDSPRDPSEYTEGVGTLPYASPEAVSTPWEVGPASDLYSLGATLYHALTNRCPIEYDDGEPINQTMGRIIHEPPTPLRAVNPTCPEPVAKLVHQLLHKNPSMRARSAIEVAREIEGLRHRLGIKAHKPESGRFNAVDPRSWLPRVVVVDDDPDVLDRMRQLLEDDYRLVATDQFSDLLQAEDCDLALIDVRMPCLSGVHLVRLLRSLGGKKQPKVVYFSSLDPDLLQQIVTDTNADGYMVKSLRNQKVVETIKTYLEA